MQLELAIAVLAPMIAIAAALTQWVHSRREAGRVQAREECLLREMTWQRQFVRRRLARASGR